MFFDVSALRGWTPADAPPCRDAWLGSAFNDGGAQLCPEMLKILMMSISARLSKFGNPAPESHEANAYVLSAPSSLAAVETERPDRCGVGIRPPPDASHSVATSRKWEGSTADPPGPI